MGRIKYINDNQEVDTHGVKIPQQVQQGLNLTQLLVSMIEVEVLVKTGLFYKDTQFLKQKEIDSHPVVSKIQELLTKYFDDDDLSEEEINFILENAKDIRFAVTCTKDVYSDDYKTVFITVFENPEDAVSDYYDTSEWKCEIENNFVSQFYQDLKEFIDTIKKDNNE